MYLFFTCIMIIHIAQQPGEICHGSQTHRLDPHSYNLFTVFQLHWHGIASHNGTDSYSGCSPL